MLGRCRLLASGFVPRVLAQGACCRSSRLFFFFFPHLHYTFSFLCNLLPYLHSPGANWLASVQCHEIAVFGTQSLFRPSEACQVPTPRMGQAARGKAVRPMPSLHLQVFFVRGLGEGRLFTQLLRKALFPTRLAIFSGH